MLDTLVSLFQYVIHLDQTVQSLTQALGPWIYILLFIVIFCETGLVITPFLPGDSLLFAVGALSAINLDLNIKLIIPLLISASFLGDSLNYLIGFKIGRKAFENSHKFSFLFNKKHLHETEEFYKKRGSLAVAISRFLPIVRTFAPFVAGLTKMPYIRFIKFSFIGSLSWVTVFSLAGYYFGRIPFIQKNFTALVMGIVIVSLTPVFFGLVKNFKKSRL